LNTLDAEELLRDYLLNGIGAQINLADQAYALAEEIGKHAKQIHGANFGELFGSLQVMLSDRQTLEATKLFDPARKYPTRSIPGTLDILERHAPLWRVPQRWKINEALVQGGADASDLNQLSKEELTHAIVNYYRTTLPDAYRLRQSRDKVIAHNEAIERVTEEAPTWGDALTLTNYAKDFIITIGYGYLDTLFGTHSSDYIPTSAAQRPAFALRRLLRTAGIVEGRQP
jgi:hypothetical protein